jgi:hypothetical protein
MCFHLGFLRLNPLLCNYSHSPSIRDLELASAYQLGTSISKWGYQFRLGEVEPSFKEFLLLLHGCVFKFKELLAYPAIIRLSLLLIKPDMGFTKKFPD